MRFLTTLAQGESKNVVGIVIPPEVIAALGGSKRPPVKVTINGYTYQSTVAVMGGDFMVGVAAEHRQKAGVSGGDRLEVQIELDTEPRVIERPDDLTAALNARGAMAAFEALAPSHRKEHVRSVNDAKSEETRRRRIDAVIQKVQAARK
jgi:hypothetical protein